MSVDFDPVKLGPRHRRTDPLTIGVVAVTVALALAVIKPWEISGSDGAPGPSAVAAIPTTAPSPSAAPTPSARVAQTISATGLPVPPWAELAPILETHDVLGVRAIVVARRPAVGLPASPRFEDRWVQTTFHTVDGSESAYLERGGESIVALGLTFPSDAVPKDARVWRLHTDDRLEWIDARPLDRVDRQGAYTFALYDAAAGGVAVWPAGRYRVDVLAGDGVHRIDVQIPGPLVGVPPPDDWPATGTNLVGPEASDPSGVRIGPFVTVDGIGVPLASRAGPPLTSEEAWRDVLGDGSGRSGSVVAAAYLPRATGLGVMLTGHAVVQGATVQRISPDTRFRTQPMLGGISDSQGRTPYVTFAPGGGGVWPPGVYAITVRWTDAGGAHVETWHVELRPGPVGASLAVR